jgi:pyruvate kinase
MQRAIPNSEAAPAHTNPNHKTLPAPPPAHTHPHTHTHQHTQHAAAATPTTRRLRPDCPIFSFTDQQDVRQRLNLRWGVMPFLLEFSPDPEDNVQRTFRLLKKRGYLAPGDLVVVVSDLRAKDADTHRSVQVRKVV